MRTHARTREPLRLTSATHEHHEAVEQTEAVRGGRVDGGADGDAAHSQLLHGAHDLIGGVGVEAGGGLVCAAHTEQELRAQPQTAG